MSYVRMNLRIGKEVKQALVDLAKEYGMSQNSLVCYILGQFVSNQKRVMQGLPEKLQALLLQEVQKVNAVEPGADEFKRRIREIRHYHNCFRDFPPGDDEGAATYGVIMRSQVHGLLQILDDAEPGADA